MKMTDEEFDLLQNWLTDDEIIELGNTIIHTLIMIDQLSPYLRKLPEISITRTLEKLLDEERITELKSLFEDREFEFATVEPYFDEESIVIKQLIKDAKEGVFDL